MTLQERIAQAKATVEAYDAEIAALEQDRANMARRSKSPKALELDLAINDLNRHRTGAEMAYCELLEIQEKRDERLANTAVMHLVRLAKSRPDLIKDHLHAWLALLTGVIDDQIEDPPPEQDPRELLDTWALSHGCFPVSFEDQPKLLDLIERVPVQHDRIKDLLS